MNKRNFLIIALVSVFGLTFSGEQSFAQRWAEIGTPWVEGTVHGYYQPMEWDSFEAGWLIGHKVHSPDGGVLGQISDLVIDKTNGRVALVILSDVPGFGTRFVAAPWGALERTGNHRFQLNFGDREIAVAGTYADPYGHELQRNMNTVGLSSVPDVVDSRWAASLYRFFGQSPYWTEAEVSHMDIMAYRVAGDTFSLTGFALGTSAAPGLFGSMVRPHDGKTESEDHRPRGRLQRGPSRPVGSRSCSGARGYGGGCSLRRTVNRGKCLRAQHPERQTCIGSCLHGTDRDGRSSKSRRDLPFLRHHSLLDPGGRIV